MKTDSTITFFLPSLGGGGAERVLVKLAGEFAASGVTVDLVLGNSDGPYVSELSEKIRIVDLQATRVASCLIPFIFYLRREKPAAVITTMMHANIMCILAVKMARLKAKVIVRESSVAEHWNGRPIHEGKSILLKLAAKIYPKADAVVSVSEGVKKSLIEALALPVELAMPVIHNPVVSDELYALAEDLDSIEELNIPTKKYIIAVGRLTPVKGFDTLIRSFALVRKQHDVSLIILGEGKYRSEYENLAVELGIEKFVIMPGFHPNPFPYIKNAELFVLSSTHEGLPNAMIQAVALGRRVVATKVPYAPAEILASGKYGESVPVGDAICMAEAIDRTISVEHWPTVGSEWLELFSVFPVTLSYLALCGVESAQRFGPNEGNGATLA